MESNDANRSRVAFVFRGSVLFILPGIYADIVYISLVDLMKEAE